MTLRKTFMVLHRFQWRQLNLNSEVGMGSTGDPPVPSGHWPDGTGRTSALETGVRKSSDAFPVPSGGSPLGTGQWPVLPTEMVTVASEFGLKAIWPNPKGIVSSSPGLRGTSYPGSALQNPTNPNGVAAIPQGRLLRLVQYGDGARASARFNAQSCGVHKTPSPLAVWTLKRRERRAPLAPLACHSVSRGSIICQHRPQPRWGCDSPAAFSQGSSCLATLGFELESLWDSHRRRHRK